MIDSYLRATSGCTWTSLGGLFYLHNQTINMYSHILGCILFLTLPFYFYWCFYQPHPNVHIADMAVMSIYCVGVAVCFACSAT